MNSDYGSVDMLNEYLAKKYQGTRLYPVKNNAGGHKTISCDIFVAAVDYLNRDEFIQHFIEIKWAKPEEVQLLIKSEGEQRFESYYPTM